jgi:hypothetical protein
MATFWISAVVGGAVPGIFVSALWLLLNGGVVPVRVGGGLAIAAVGLDAAHRHGVRIARPLAVFRQVPRDWGHRVGPWWAAVRYGFRMGFGPATILVSWSWWAGFVLVISAGPVSAFVGAVVFAAARTITMAVATGDVCEGTAMAERSARLDVISGVAAKLLMVLTVVLGLFGAAGLMS